MKAHAYNYSVFPPDDDVEAFAAWGEFLKAGHRAPYPHLLDLDSGDMVRLTSGAGSWSTTWTAPGTGHSVACPR